MRLLMLLAAAAWLSPAQDAAEIVRRSAEVDRQYLNLVRQYTFIERQENRELDSGGTVKDRESRTWDITMLEGTPYRRLLARNDKALEPKEEQKEKEKLQRSIAQRRDETDAQRQARYADADRRLQKQREPVREIPNAFDLRVAGEDTVNGAAAWVIEATPKPGYRPRSSLSQFFPKVRGKIWIAKADHQWVRVEAES